MRWSQNSITIKTVSQLEISFKNFGLEFPKSAAQHSILNLTVFRIKGEHQFNYLVLISEHCVCHKKYTLHDT